MLGNAQTEGTSLSVNTSICQTDTTAVNTTDIEIRLNSGELDPGEESANQTITELIFKLLGLHVVPCKKGPRKVSKEINPFTQFLYVTNQSIALRFPQIIHKVPNEFHWPPIIRGSCDNLFCWFSKCVPCDDRFFVACTNVYKMINGQWAFVGLGLRRVPDHLKCGCE